MSADTAYQNLVYRMGLITRTETALCTLRFEEYDPTGRGRVAQGAGGLRKFWVEWMGSDADSAATDMDRREAFHTFRLHVEYPRCLTYANMHLLILRDRDDILTAIRDANQSNLLGYDADHTTTDIGLYSRTRTGDELNKSNPDLWRLSIQWRCKVRESEI